MTKKRTDEADRAAAGLRHNPFAILARRQGQQREGSIDVAAASSARAPVTTSLGVREAERPRSVRACLEAKGRTGKVITRITGLPRANVTAIASRLQRGLGCSASVEGDDVVLEGSLAERASRWLEAAGDLRAIREEPISRQALTGASARAPSEWPPSARDGAGMVPSAGSGTKRADVRPGTRVAIVLKADQASGKLTEGIVRDILTSSPTHPRGIKVRLETGEVGRVKFIAP